MSQKLNQTVIEEFLKVKEDGNLYHRESQNLEFKESYNFAGLAEYLRDFSAFANNKGGYLIFGVKDKPKRELAGLADRAKEQFDKLDPEKISGFLLDIFSGHVSWEHEIFSIYDKYYGVFYVHEAFIKPIVCKKDEGRDQELRNGEIYFRYGGRTQKIQYSELEAIINARIEMNNSQWVDLVNKIGKSGPQNAAILDTEKDLIEKNESRILVVDEELVKSIQWIREGDFSEVKGERTLKLIGSVQPIEHVEVVKRIKENKLKEYPLTATEMYAEVQKRLPRISRRQIQQIIAENDIKKNKEYSDFVLKSKKQEDDYELHGTYPITTPFIYKVSIIEFIINVFKNDNL